jgi:DNA-3-methyladenine glycosylase
VTSRLDRRFFARDPRIVAEALLGKYLVHRTESAFLGGRIVETEAYLGPEDLASHARFGPRGRSRHMFGEAGVAYVYLIYGMYDCFNVVTGPVGEPSAVLVRALEPLPGTERCDGPGRLTRALAIDRRYDGVSIVDDGRLEIVDRGEPAPRVRATARIGVAYAGPWARRWLRYVDADSQGLTVRLPGRRRPRARSR